MTEQHGSDRLLDMLHRLFSRVSQLDLEKRKNAYRPRTARSVDLSSLLNPQIERLARQSTSRSVNSSGEPVHSSASSTRAPLSSSGPDVADSSADEVIKYFKSRALESSSGAYMGQRLIASTWSHIHTAILQARQGDLARARLHVDIASQALRESAHYLTDDEYQSFAEDVQQALGMLDTQKH